MSVASAGTLFETQCLRIRSSGRLKDFSTALRACAVEVNTAKSPAPSIITVTKLDALNLRNGLTTRSLAEILKEFWTNCTTAGVASAQPTTGSTSRGYTAEMATSGAALGASLKTYVGT